MHVPLITHPFYGGNFTFWDFYLLLQFDKSSSATVTVKFTVNLVLVILRDKCLKWLNWLATLNFKSSFEFNFHYNLAVD